jgi:hypothetical protein
MHITTTDTAHKLTVIMGLQVVVKAALAVSTVKIQMTSMCAVLECVLNLPILTKRRQQRSSSAV